MKIIAIRVGDPGRLGGPPGPGQGGFERIKIKYPLIAVKKKDLGRILARPEIARAGWNRDNILALLSGIKEVVDSMHGQIGHYPPLNLYLDLDTAPTLSPALKLYYPDRAITVYLGNDENKRDYMLSEIKRLTAEHLGQFFLAHSPESFAQLQDTRHFVIGITDNPYLTGLRIRPTSQLSKLLALYAGPAAQEIGGAEVQVDEFWRLASVVAPEIVRAKVVKLLCPDFPFLRESFAGWLDAQVKGFVAAQNGEENVPSNFDLAQMLVLLAHGTALAEAKGGHSDLAAAARQNIRAELAPNEARVQLADALLRDGVGPMALSDHQRAQEEAIREISGKAIKWFDAIRETYLGFFAGINFKR
jgi:hypothetical protein